MLKLQLPKLKLRHLIFELKLPPSFLKPRSPISKGPAPDSKSMESDSEARSPMLKLLASESKALALALFHETLGHTSKSPNRLGLPILDLHPLILKQRLPIFKQWHSTLRTEALEAPASDPKAS